MGFARLMATPLGRGGRVVLGLVLIIVGIGIVDGVAGWIVAFSGLLPLTLGVINGCVLAPLLKVPFKGSDLPPSDQVGQKPV